MNIHRISGGVNVSIISFLCKSTGMVLSYDERMIGMMIKKVWIKSCWVGESGERGNVEEVIMRRFDNAREYSAPFEGEVPQR